MQLLEVRDHFTECDDASRDTAQIATKTNGKNEGQLFPKTAVRDEDYSETNEAEAACHRTEEEKEHTVGGRVMRNRELQ